MHAYNMPAINYELLLLLFITVVLLQITCVFLTNYQSVNVHFYQVYKKHLFINYTTKKEINIFR